MNSDILSRSIVDTFSKDSVEEMSKNILVNSLYKENENILNFLNMSQSRYEDIKENRSILDKDECFLIAKYLKLRYKVLNLMCETILDKLGEDLEDEC